MIDVAYLRVFRPAEEIRLPVTDRWGDVPRLGEAVLTTESQTADAWEVEWGGRLWRCARTPRRRMLESLVAHQRATERYGTGMIDRNVAAAAKRELSRIRTGVPRPAPVMASAWHPPLRWFIAFDPDDRCQPMQYRTPVELALVRLETAAEAMREAGLPPMWVDEVTGLGEWLKSFGADSLLELDYREVARHLDPLDRDWDETAADVAASVEALADGDLAEATSRYGSALARWSSAQAIGYSS
jgi:hypothetical protein